MKPAIDNLLDWLKQYEGKMISADQVILEAQSLKKQEWEEVMKAYDKWLPYNNENK
jgi:hypothetical protein